MESGSYKQKKIDFSQLRVTKVPMTFYSDIGFEFGCGASALALLCGINPLILQTKSGHYSDRYMIATLKQHGIDAYKITKSNLTNYSSIVYKLDDRHVILACQLLQKATASWAIWYRKQIYHNFEVSKVNFFDLVNFPVCSMFCLYKPSWK
jgi:hypothetical protein